jgi:hypothetical protein
MESRDKIAVLLAEYNTLRSEEQHRLSVLIQCTAIAITVLSGLVGLRIYRPETQGVYFFMGLTLLFYGVVYLLVDINVFQESKKIRQLERRINALAKTRLLTWEVECGWGGAWPRPRKMRDRIDGIGS